MCSNQSQPVGLCSTTAPPGRGRIILNEDTTRRGMDRDAELMVLNGNSQS